MVRINGEVVREAVHRPRPAPGTTLAERFAAKYCGIRPAASGAPATLSGALDNYFNRRAMGLREDPEGLRNMRAERKSLETLARNAEVDPAALDTLLKVQHEYDSFPRGDKAKETLRSATRERLRLLAGDTAGRDQMLNDYVLATAVIQKEARTFADRMTATGADLD
ncbi:MAG TPA: hypothetical protein VK437_14930, partial [Steroidobacteraceae bacterium]|nr:hypothetical protein [Steroidobacteraceae bacterium]